MTDRAQDTEAIRAVLQYCADNSNSEAMADAAEAADYGLDRLVARLEAAELALRQTIGACAPPVEALLAVHGDGKYISAVVLEGLSEAAAVLRREAAALAAAAPGETALAEPGRERSGQTQVKGRASRLSPGSASAAPGETTRCLIMVETRRDTYVGCALMQGHDGPHAAPGETEQTP